MGGVWTLAGALPIFNRINYRRGCFMKNFIAPRSLSGTLSLPKCLPKGRLITIFLLAAFFALSACDDSSSASSDETGTSSSSVESSSSSVTLSGASAESNGSSDENMEKDKSSSSVKGSEPVEVSSSSAKETKNSSDSKSSSSIKSGDSSSSKKDASSSSEDSSSSEKTSSTSVESSQSICYDPIFYREAPFESNLYKAGAYKKYVDKRDGQDYYYIKIKGKKQNGYPDSVTVFAENLRYGNTVSGDHDQIDDKNIEKYCYDNDSLCCEMYGGLYQWAEAMGLSSECNTKSCAHLISNPSNHQGICPDGWRLMTYNDYYIIVHSTEYLSVGMRSQYTFQGMNNSGFSGTGTGYRQSSKKKFVARLRVMGWYYPGEMEEDGVIYPRMGTLSTTIDGWETEDAAANDTKLDGYSVRCVMVNQE